MLLRTAFRISTMLLFLYPASFNPCLNTELIFVLPGGRFFTRGREFCPFWNILKKYQINNRFFGQIAETKIQLCVIKKYWPDHPGAENAYITLKFGVIPFKSFAPQFRVKCFFLALIWSSILNILKISQMHCQE